MINFYCKLGGVNQYVGALRDLTGLKFGNLTVISRDGSNKYKKATWWCRCDCDGNEKSYISSNLINGNTKSCGCLHDLIASEVNKKYNTYDLSGEYGVGFTSNTNREFYFDLEDYDKIKNYCWSEKKDGGYIVTKPNGTTVSLHRLVMNPNDEELIDHIFHKTYDNRKSQLRICTINENGCNMVLPSHNTSGVKGVRFHSRDLIWEAFITHNQKYIHLGRYTNKDDAIQARYEAELKYQKSFRYQNKIS